jgi:class 3 adenylate cyclase
VKLNSKRKYLTVFFSDIKGFTELTDTIETETLTQILNEYLDVMSQIAIKHGGTIDKYIGDCIMVFFGDPNSNGKIVDAINCLSMAIEMKSSMTALRMRWHRDGLSNPFSVRMGINSGYCTVGNFGSKNRMDYTIVGGVVNLASRLESNANPNEILISSETYSLVKDNIECVKKDEITVKGISHKVQTYEVISDKHKSTIIEEKKGFNLIIDLNEIDKDKVIEYLENKINYFRDIK